MVQFLNKPTVTHFVNLQFYNWFMLTCAKETFCHAAALLI